MVEKEALPENVWVRGSRYSQGGCSLQHARSQRRLLLACRRAEGVHVHIAGLRVVSACAVEVVQPRGNLLMGDNPAEQLGVDAPSRAWVQACATSICVAAAKTSAMGACQGTGPRPSQIASSTLQAYLRPNPKPVSPLSSFGYRSSRSGRTGSVGISAESACARAGSTGADALAPRRHLRWRKRMRCSTWCLPNACLDHSRLCRRQPRSGRRD